MSIMYILAAQRDEHNIILTIKVTMKKLKQEFQTDWTAELQQKC